MVLISCPHEARRADYLTFLFKETSNAYVLPACVRNPHPEIDLNQVIERANLHKDEMLMLNLCWRGTENISSALRYIMNNQAGPQRILVILNHMGNPLRGKLPSRRVVREVYSYVESTRHIGACIINFAPKLPELVGSCEDPSCAECLAHQWSELSLQN